MQKNTSISLGNHFEEFILQQITSGRFGSASETVRAGLRLLEDHESKLATLRQALADGEKSGKTKYSLKSLKKELDSE
jgi:antitoxin ParD1/3/4